MTMEGNLDASPSYAAAVERYNRPLGLEHNPHPAIQKFIHAAERHYETPLGNEQSTKAFWGAVTQFPDGTLLTPAIIDLMETRAGNAYIDPKITKSDSLEDVDACQKYRALLDEHLVDDEIMGVFRSCVIQNSRSIDPKFTDINRVDITDWRMPLEAFVAAYDKKRVDPLADQVFTNLSVRKVSTSVPQRYVPTELLLQSLRERYPDGVRMLEIGSSVMFVKWLRHKSDDPMKIESVSDPIRRDVTEKANRLLQLPSLLRECVCVDIQPIFNQSRDEYDDQSVEWVISSSRPSERNSQEYMDRFRRLIAIRDPQVRFAYTNLLVTRFLEEFKQENPQPFDIVLKPTLSHQLGSNNSVMDVAVKHLVAPDGLLIEQDFMYLNPRRRDTPVPLSARRIKKIWTEPYAYTTNVVDFAQHPVGFQKVFDFEDNSRCQRMRIHAAKLLVGGKVVAVDELISQ